MNRAIFLGLMLLVALSPLPLGSNREWSWSLCALVISVLATIWVVSNFRHLERITRLPNWLLLGLFAITLVWILVQMMPGVPESWKHPLWFLASEAFAVNLPGSISLSPDEGWTALMRLLAYALVFLLAYQLGRDRNRAQMTFAFVSVVGFVYALYGLYVFWSGNDPEWLFGSRNLPHDVRSTFVNRNHFATWLGLALLCAIGWFYQRMVKPNVMPYFVPKGRDDRVEKFILKAWKPLIIILLMVTALILTHSRGGFVATLAGTIVLMVLLDRRGSRGRAISRASVVAALLIAVTAFYLTSDVLMDRLERTNLDSEERLVLFRDVNRGIGDNPALGFGYGTFGDSFRLYDRTEAPVHFDRAHNTWLENVFELGFPAAMAFYLCLAGLVLRAYKGVNLRHRDWVYPATGVAASVLVGVHAVVDFSLQIPAVALLYACIMGLACAQFYSSGPARKGDFTPPHR